MCAQNNCTCAPTRRTEWELYEEISEEAKTENPDIRWELYKIKCDDLRFAQDHKANHRGTRGKR